MFELIVDVIPILMLQLKARSWIPLHYIFLVDHDLWSILEVVDYEGSIVACLTHLPILAPALILLRHC